MGERLKESTINLPWVPSADQFRMKSKDIPFMLVRLVNEISFYHCLHFIYQSLCKLFVFREKTITRMNLRKKQKQQWKLQSQQCVDATQHTSVHRVCLCFTLNGKQKHSQLEHQSAWRHPWWRPCSGSSCLWGQDPHTLLHQPSSHGPRHKSNIN